LSVVSDLQDITTDSGQLTTDIVEKAEAGDPRKSPASIST